MSEFLIVQCEDAKDLPIPAYATEESAGMDLYANVNEPEIIKKGEIKIVSVGIKLKMPKGYEGQIRARSGLASKYGIGLVNAPGTIDSDYRGEIKVILINFGTDDFLINRGDRIAQIVFNKIKQVELVVVDEKELNMTARGDGGFGHTGK